jgi:uncharacterized protein
MNLAELPSVPVLGYVLLKLSARCNLACDYCYWFRDASVLRKPGIFTREAERAFCAGLERHLQKYQLEYFQILLHGGEPLLFPRERMECLLSSLREIGARTRTDIDLILTTNAVLIDEDWISLFKKFNVAISVSLDGDPEQHDLHRFDHRGRGSYSAVTRGLSRLHNHGFRPGIICVCDPRTSPTKTAHHLVEVLGIHDFDVLPPDHTHEDTILPIANYYTELFDLWYTKLYFKGVKIRILQAIVSSLFGRDPITDSIGLGEVHTVVVNTDGAIEPLDVLRIAGDGSTSSELNVFENTIQDVSESKVWMDAFLASTRLPKKCTDCAIRDVCGGGHLAHRYSKESQYDNPSVYCDDWINIFCHVAESLAKDVRLTDSTGTIRLSEICEASWHQQWRSRVASHSIQRLGDCLLATRAASRTRSLSSTVAMPCEA